MGVTAQYEPAGRESAPGQQAAAALAPRASRWLLFTAGRVVLVAWVAATLGFLVIQLTPGNAASIILAGKSNLNLTSAERAQIVAQFGFNKPVPVQYLNYVLSVAHLNFGVSYTAHIPVISVIGQQVGYTIELAVAGVVLALAVAVAVATGSVMLPRGGRLVVSLIELLAMSSPSFWLGIILLTLFSFTWRLFPATGANGISSLFLPALTLALPMAGTFSQVLRPELEREITEPYFITARARGRGFASVVVRHALPHAFLPILTLSSTYFAYFAGGAVIVENLFGRPGLGQLTINAVTAKDTPVICAVVILSAVAYVVVNALVDVLYHVLDPRLREAQ